MNYALEATIFHKGERWRFRPGRAPLLAAVLALLVAGASARVAPPAEVTPAVDEPLAGHPFDPNVRVMLTDDRLIVESDGIPTHATATFPNATNPNRILKQAYRFFIPRRPRKAEKPTPTPFGPIGVAVNGVPFYNPYNAEGRDAVLGPFAEIFDSCCGHPDPMGRYHYHKYPVCVKSPFQNTTDEHSPILGLMFDGFALYGPNGSNGKPAADLDECNGHEDKERGYHYHVTEKFPYLIGAYRGVPDPASIDRPRFPGRNGPFAMAGPGSGPPPNPIVIALDTNRDGSLSADEIQSASKALLALDRNKDGALSRDETRPPGPFRPFGPPPPGGSGTPPPPAEGDGPPPREGGPPPNPLMVAIDTDGDGTLSAEEIERAPTTLRILDVDHDGRLSIEEIRPRMPNGPRSPRGGPRPGSGPPAGGPRGEPPDREDPRAEC